MFPSLLHWLVVSSSGLCPTASSSHVACETPAKCCVCGACWGLASWNPKSGRFQHKNHIPIPCLGVLCWFSEGVPVKRGSIPKRMATWSVTSGKVGFSFSVSQLVDLCFSGNRVPPNFNGLSDYHDFSLLSGHYWGGILCFFGKLVSVISLIVA
jgi:hypothetical protein